MPIVPRARRVLPVLVPLLLATLLVACKREPEELAGATSEPAATVRELVDHLRRDDLAGFARAAVPPADHAVLETAWREDRSRWPLTELPLSQQLVPMLATFSAPGSEQALMRDFNRQFARQDRDLRDAARSLGLFGVQYLKKEGEYSPTQRVHYTQVVQALSAWAQDAPLADPALARNTINRMAAAARKAGLSSEADLRAAGMDGSLRRLAPVLAETKATFTRYGLPLETTLADLRTGLVEQKGDRATVRIHYPLGNREIDSQVSLERRDGRWYLSDYLRAAERARPPPPPPAEPPAEPEPTTSAPPTTAAR
jgi:hypothetical protein